MPTHEQWIRMRGVGKRRRIVTKEQSKRMSEHARKTRGQDIHSMKADHELDERIELVVRLAQANGTCHSADVVNGFRHVAHSTLRARRVG